MLITVFGGTGFLGRQIVQQLQAQGMAVRVAVRHPERGADLGPQVEVVKADVLDRESLAPAVAGADGVVNAVSLYVERRHLSFHDVHVLGARNLAEAAADAGVERLVHISGIGIDSRSASAYVRSRAEGEAAVQAAFPGVTLLRPSVLFGPGDALLSALDGVTRLPVIPLFGDGRTRQQPIHVDNVAQATAQALARPESAGRIYELGGDRSYQYRELVRLVQGYRHRHGLLLPFPFFAWRLLARCAQLLPNPPLTRDQVILLEMDNIVSGAEPGLAELGVEPLRLEAELSHCLP